jgi:glycosyltransferase involved in cell wall biosynthesis
MTEPREFRVSVIIPHYNADRFLPKALASVANQETLPAVNTIHELLVIDDGSDEESWTRAIVDDNRGTTFIRHSKNRGQGFVLNYGVDRALGDILMFLDADDVWMPDKVSEQLDAFTDESVDMVTCHASNFHGSEMEAPVPARIMSALAIRNTAMARIGPFREDLGAGMTLEWFDRATSLDAKLVVLPDLLVMRRIHTENYGVVNRERARQEYLNAVKIIEERKRGPADKT